MNKINLKEFGIFLGTRQMGIQVQSRISHLLESQPFVIIDFDGVDGITNSFADESFGKLIQALGIGQFKEKIKFQNLNSLVKVIISHALQNRAPQNNDPQPSKVSST